VPVILGTEEKEIRKIAVQRQPEQIVLEPYLKKNPSQKRDGRVTQGVGPEFKPQYLQKKKKRKEKGGLRV
jgi:hypothetical protein